MAFKCQLSVRLGESWPMSCQWMKQHVSLLTFSHVLFLTLRLQGQRHSDGPCFFLVHAAVIAINEAIDRGQAPLTMAALNNPNAMLRNVQEVLAEDYQNTLSQSKTRKLNQSSAKVRKLRPLMVFVILCYMFSSCSCIKTDTGLLLWEVLCLVLTVECINAGVWTTVDYYSTDSLHMHGQHIPLAAESAVIH